MGRFYVPSVRSLKWAALTAGLLATSCAGAIGAGAALVVVGAGVLTFTCYDRVAVTVTDRVTGAPLCDAKVSFFKGKSETVATSCYQAALSSGSYTLRVERPGLETFEEPVEVSKTGQCGQTVQTMYIALDRKDGVHPPQQVAPPARAVTAPPAATPAPAVAVPAASATPAVAAPPAATAPPTPTATPGAQPSASALPAAPPPPPGAPAASAPPAPPSSSFPAAP